MSEGYISSDSEDCYGNIAQKLQNIKSKYEINSKSVNVFSESVDTKNDCVTLENRTKTPENVIVEKNITLNDSEEIDLDLIIAQNSKGRPKRSNRRTAETSTGSVTNVRSSRRGKKKANDTESTTVNSRRGRRGGNSGNTIENFFTRGNARQRGGRAQRGRARSQQMIHNLPIFSVGNTDEYPDRSDNVELFKQVPNDVIIIEDEQTEDIEELSVKVYWQSLEIKKFMLRKYQKFTPVFEYFSKKENVSNEKLFFTYNDRIVTLDDTPDSIDYNIGKFIDGGIINQDVSQLVRKNKNGKTKNGINLKFQCMNLKKPYEITMNKDEKMHIAMVKFAEHMEIGFHKLKFYFDGDQINGKLTPNELDLEGGECIDVKITN